MHTSRRILAVILAGTFACIGCQHVVTRNNWNNLSNKEVQIFHADLNAPVLVTTRLLLLPEDQVPKLNVPWDISLKATVSAGSPEEPSSHDEELKACIIGKEELSRILTSAAGDRRYIEINLPKAGIIAKTPTTISLLERRNYVVSLNQEPKGTTRRIATLEWGFKVELMAEGVADGIQLTLKPKLIHLDGIDLFTLEGGEFVELPRLTKTEFSASKLMPDGTTMLVMGPMVTEEVVVEQSVPGWSELPGIGRLFTNRSYVRDSRRLMMVIQPVKSAPASAVVREADGSRWPR